MYRGISYIEGCSLEPAMASRMHKRRQEKNPMNSTNDSPDMHEQQDNSNGHETAERKWINRVADELAQRAHKRQLDYGEEHNIFTK
jgi:hypothetical protein